MLVIISFAGVLAARNSILAEQISNNVRTVNVSQQAAEIAIRYCEAVAIDATDNGGANYATDVARIISTKASSVTASDAQWNSISNWASGASSLITVPQDIYAPTASGSKVDAGARLAKAPTCLVQRLTASADNHFLITARGLSNDAQLNSSGRLTNGSETWLQSILTPGIPTASSQGGVKGG